MDKKRKAVVTRVLKGQAESVKGLSNEAERIDRQIDAVMKRKAELAKKRDSFVTKFTPSGQVHMNAEFLPGYEEAASRVKEADKEHGELHSNYENLKKRIKGSPYSLLDLLQLGSTKKSAGRGALPTRAQAAKMLKARRSKDASK